MIPNVKYEYSNLDALLDDLDAPCLNGFYNLVENTHPVYYYRNTWGVVAAYVIDAGKGSNLQWELNV